MNLFELILASGSPRRALLLCEAGYDFRILPADEGLEEQAEADARFRSLDPIAMVGLLSYLKAENVLKKLVAERQGKNDSPVLSLIVPSLTRPPFLILACDSLAVCKGEILGKPKDRLDALRMLTLLNGSRHEVHTGITLWPFGKEFPFQAVETSTLVMKSLSAARIEEYLNSGLWEGKAGAFGYQDDNDWLHLEQGSESNVVGLPLERFREMLEEVFE